MEKYQQGAIILGFIFLIVAILSIIPKIISAIIKTCIFSAIFVAIGIYCGITTPYQVHIMAQNTARITSSAYSYIKEVCMDESVKNRALTLGKSLIKKD